MNTCTITFSGAAGRMSATSLGFLAVWISALCLAFLAASDAKRLPERRTTVSGLRRLAIALAILPGAVLAITGDWVGFLIWLGPSPCLAG